jgi:hypothetical protein
METWKVIIWQQFGAAIDMLENAIEACPDNLWGTARNGRSSGTRHITLFSGSTFTFPRRLTDSLHRLCSRLTNLFGRSRREVAVDDGDRLSSAVRCRQSNGNRMRVLLHGYERLKRFESISNE